MVSLKCHKQFPLNSAPNKSNFLPFRDNLPQPFAIYILFSFLPFYLFSSFCYTKQDVLHILLCALLFSLGNLSN